MSSTEKTYEVVMPKLGLIMTEAQLVEWHQGNQDWVDAGQPLFSLESEKSIIDIEAPASGYLQILVPAGDTVPVMTPVALISAEAGAEGQPAPAAVPASGEVKPVSQPAAKRPAASAPGEVRATPKARRLAQDRGLDLRGRTGSGPRAMVVSADLDALARSRSAAAATPVARQMAADFGLDLDLIDGTGPGGKITREDLARTVRSLLMGRSIEGAVQGQAPASEPPRGLSGLRAVIAERLTRSWNERPQVTLYAELDASQLVGLRQKLKEAGKAPSYNAFILLACACSLQEHPEINTQLTAEGLIQLEGVNIGLAVDTDRGLMVPVIKNADQTSLEGIQSRMEDLVDRTLKGSLLPDEYSGGGFTVTNLGGFGVDSFSPIINPPESAILGVGRIKQVPAVVEGQVEVRDSLTLGLSFDHRLIDGAPAARFLQTVVSYLEKPDLLTEA